MSYDCVYEHHDDCRGESITDCDCYCHGFDEIDPADAWSAVTAMCFGMMIADLISRPIDPPVAGSGGRSATRRALSWILRAPARSLSGRRNNQTEASSHSRLNAQPMRTADVTHRRLA